MSLQTVLAAGFLFLGGILILLTHQLTGISQGLFLLGIILALLGGGLLVAHLVFAFDHHFPKYTPDTKKEDSHEDA